MRQQPVAVVFDPLKPFRMFASGSLLASVGVHQDGQVFGRHPSRETGNEVGGDRLAGLQAEADPGGRIHRHQAIETGDDRQSLFPQLLTTLGLVAVTFLQQLVGCFQVLAAKTHDDLVGQATWLTCDRINLKGNSGTVFHGRDAVGQMIHQHAAGDLDIHARHLGVEATPGPTPGVALHVAKRRAFVESKLNAISLCETRLHGMKATPYGLRCGCGFSASRRSPSASWPACELVGRTGKAIAELHAARRASSRADGTELNAPVNDRCRRRRRTLFLGRISARRRIQHRRPTPIFQSHS